MKTAFLVLFLFIAIVGCEEKKTRSADEIMMDSTNGISEAEFKKHFIDSAMQRIKQDAAFKDTANMSESPIKVISARPVTKDYSNYKDISLTYKNISGKTIAAIRFKWYGINAFGEPADMGVLSDGIGAGFTDNKLKVGKTASGEWSILSKDLKKVVKAWAYEVAFEDRTKWTAK